MKFISIIFSALLFLFYGWKSTQEVAKVSNERNSLQLTEPASTFDGAMLHENGMMEAEKAVINSVHLKNKQQKWFQYVDIEATDSDAEIIKKAAHVVPSERQMAWQELEFTCFIYLSPWDMNQSTYGKGAYNDFFVNQLTELLTNYGPVAEVWFDGACGEGPGGKKQVYDWERYYQREDSLVKTPEKLVDIYYSSLGQNSLLLLNLPPDKRGLIHENDIKSLMGMKKILEETFLTNLMEGARVKATHSQKHHPPEHLNDKKKETYWTTEKNQWTAAIEFDLGREKTFDRFSIRENIRNGQRIEQFVLEYRNGDEWTEFSRGTTVGYQRLLRFEPVKAQKIRLKILASRDCPEITEAGLYQSPGNRSSEL